MRHALRDASRLSIAAVGMLALLALAACSGGESGGGAASTATPITGTFVDSPVNGLHYTSVPSNPAGGVTANGGRYQCVPGDTVTFDLGGRVIGTGRPCGPLVTVVSVFGATSTTDLRVRNLAQLLLTLGGIPAGVQPIDLPVTIPATLPARLDFTDPNFEQMLLTTLPNKTLATQEQVVAHLRASFTTLTVSANGGRITSTPAGLVCTAGTCSYDFVNGTRVTLAAIGTGFTGWNGNGCTGTGTCQIMLTTVQAIRAIFRPAPSALSIVTTSLPTGGTGQPYSATLAAAGGTPPYTWSRTSGTLPAGLTLNGATGQISGTPTGTGTFSPTFRVRDSGNPQQTTTRQLSLTIASEPSTVLTLTNAPAASGGTFAPGRSSTFYSPGDPSDPSFPASFFVSWFEQHPGNMGAGEYLSLQYSAATRELESLGYGIFDPADPNGGINAFCSVQSGTPCTGVTLNVSAGTLTAANTVVTDNFLTPISVTLNGSLTFSPVAIVGSSVFSSAIVGQPYSRSLEAIGGTPPYTWTIDPASASLPGGLSFGNTGVLSGTPTVAGYFGDDDTTGALLFRVTDAQGHVTLADSLLIIHPSGTTSVPNSRVLASNFGSPSSATAFYDGQGRLIGADAADAISGFFFSIGRGTLAPTDIFSTPSQIVRMSRWAGPGRGAGIFSGAATANQGSHNVSGIPTAVGNLPTTGQTIYNVIASTHPTVDDGSAAPGTGVTGTVTVNWVTRAVSFNLMVNSPRGALPFQLGPTTLIDADGLILAGIDREVDGQFFFDSASGSFYGTEAIPQCLGLTVRLGGTVMTFPSNDVLAAVVLERQP